MSYIPWDEIVDPRYLKINFKKYVYYIVLVLIFYTPRVCWFGNEKNFKSYERGSPFMAASPPPSEMENEIEIRFHFEKSSRIKKLFALRAAQFFLIWVIVVQRLRSIAWGHPETPSSLVTVDQTMPGPLPSTSGACGHTFFSKARRKA